MTIFCQSFAVKQETNANEEANARKQRKLAVWWLIKQK